MKYINKASERKLVSIGRVKKWVGSGEVVDLSSSDVRFLGINSIHIVQYVDAAPKVTKTKSAKLKPASKQKVAKKKTAPKRKSMTSAAKETIGKVIEKISKSKSEKTKAQTEKELAKLAKLAKLGKILKLKLINKSKVDLVAFGKKNLGIDLNPKERKSTIIKRSIIAAKKIGYKKVLKRI